MKPLWLIIAAALLLAAWRLRRLGRWTRGALVVVAIAAAVVGVGVLHLPTVEEVVKAVGDSLGQWSYLVVGVNAFLETGAFLGFLAPGETVVLFGGVLAGEGTIDLWVLIAVVWASAMLGDITSYWVGRRAGRDFLLRHGSRVKIGEEQIQAVERFFDRYGRATVLLGRWVGMIRPLVPFLAGSSRLPFGIFLAIDIVATGIWSIALCVLGSVFWQRFDQLVGIVGQVLTIAGTVIVVTAVLVAGVNARRNPKRSQAIDDWLLDRRHHWPGLIVRPLGWLWAGIGRLEQRLPGARRRAPQDDTVAAGSPDRGDPRS